jgi:hypothetical protein
MAEAVQRRTLRHKNVPAVISSKGKESTLTVNGTPVSFTKSKDNKFHTIHLPHAEFKDLETMARAIIDVFPSVGAK